MKKEKENKEYYKNLRTGEIAEKVTYIDEYGFYHSFFNPNIEIKNGDILEILTSKKTLKNQL